MTDAVRPTADVDTEWLVNQIAHVLRNPIFAAMVQADTLTLRLPADSPLGRPARILAEQLARLEGMIEEMLLLGRPVRVAPRRVELMRVVGDLAAAFAVGHRGETAEVMVTGSYDDQLETDPDLLRIVLERLIENAAQHTEPPHRVELELAAMEHGVRLAVTDHGHGMSPAMVSEATLPFHPQHRGRPGLGLAIADKMTAALGGRLTIHSVEGEGTRVTVDLPLAPGGAV